MTKPKYAYFKNSTKKIGGHNFKYHGRHAHKSDAEASAKRLRESGHLARVIHYKGNQYPYTVFAAKK